MLPVIQSAYFIIPAAAAFCFIAVMGFVSIEDYLRTCQPDATAHPVA